MIILSVVPPGECRFYVYESAVCYLLEFAVSGCVSYGDGFCGHSDVDLWTFCVDFYVNNVAVCV